MAKRKRHQGPEPTLFDLPLRAAHSEKAAGETASSRHAIAASGDGRGPSILFDEPEDSPGEDHAAGDAQLELIDLATADAELPESPAGAPAAAAQDDQALLGDRLLGGLADLAAQLIALGLAIAATHSMGLAVTVADWMPFGVLALVFSFLYWVVPLAFWGQTPGMAWVGQTARSSSGEPLSFGQTVLRWLGSMLTLALAGLPLLLALTGRSFTDLLSGSRTAAS